MVEPVCKVKRIVALSLLCKSAAGMGESHCLLEEAGRFSGRHQQVWNGGVGKVQLE